MNGKCNIISMDEGALMASLRLEAQDALELEGQKLVNHMRREIRNTTHGGAPGKPEWHKEIADNLGRVAIAVTETSVSVDVGYSPSDKADEARAMIVEAGSGSEAGNEPVHAGPTGRSVWNEDVNGKHPSRAKSEYLLPAAFNQKGNQFVENAMRLMKTDFGNVTEAAFALLPDSSYYGNVVVKES